MRKMTLLQMTQNILSAMDSDEVSSISDTVESVQVAEILKETYDELFNNINVPELHGLVQLEDVNNLARPNYLKVPSDVNKVEWIKYRDYRAGGTFRDISYIRPEPFLRLQLNYVEGPGYSVTSDPSTAVSYFVRNDSPPTYFTSFDDTHLAFDSFDLEFEASLHSDNSLAFGWKSPDFKMEDDFIPQLDATLFPLLLAEAKSTAFINLKQISSSKEEQRARRQRIRMQNDQFKSRRAQYAYWNRGPNYGFHW